MLYYPKTEMAKYTSHLIRISKATRKAPRLTALNRNITKAVSLELKKME